MIANPIEGKYLMQQELLRNRLNIVRFRLTNCLLFPESVVGRFGAELAARQTEYNKAYESYNNFLDSKISEKMHTGSSDSSL